MGDVVRPDWWDLPAACPRGHPWGPRRVIRGWLPCGCRAHSPEGDPQDLRGHQWAKCHPPDDVCDEVWYSPPHDPDLDLR